MFLKKESEYCFSNDNGSVECCNNFNIFSVQRLGITLILGTRQFYNIQLADSLVCESRRKLSRR